MYWLPYLEKTILGIEMTEVAPLPEKDTTISYSVRWFIHRYRQLEDEFLTITDYVPLRPDLEEPNYKFGSPMLMDFGLKIGTEVETLFRVLLNSDRYDHYEDVDEYRAEEGRHYRQTMRVYREIVGEELGLATVTVRDTMIGSTTTPFAAFAKKKSPHWLKTYSRLKHDKLRLIDEWTLLDAFHALGGLLILIVNHPDHFEHGYNYDPQKYRSKVFVPPEPSWPEWVGKIMTTKRMGDMQNIYRKSPLPEKDKS